MSLIDGNTSIADVAALMGNNDNFGGNGNGGWWFLFMLLILANGGFGNWAGNGNGGGNNAWCGNGGSFLPYMLYNNTDNDVQRGFDQSAVMDSLGNIGSNVQNGFANVNTGLCNGFAGVNQNVSNGFANTNLAISNCAAGINQALCNGFNGVNQAVSGGFQQAEISANNRQMANMQQGFNQQVATQQGFNGVTQQLAAMQGNFDSCCCDTKAQNAANYADLKYTVATENCQDRYEAANNTRDIIQSNTANTQALLNTINQGIQGIQDKLCSQELQAERRENQNLRSELMYARGQASQTAQTAAFLDNNNAQTAAILAGQAQRANEIEQYVNPTPRPAYIVQNPNCCTGYNNNCGYA